MKSIQDPFPAPFIGGVCGLIVESLGQGRPREFIQARPRVPADGEGLGRSVREPEGLLARVGRRIMRRKMQGIAPQLASSQDVFDRLDRWLWTQHLRETEAYLAKSLDVFDLERRMQDLERRAGPRF